MGPAFERLTIDVGGEAAARVDGVAIAPPGAQACYVFAHGAGAGMDHVFMAACAAGLAERGIATLRFQFPSMQSGSRRPDPPERAHATVRAAVAVAARLFPALPLLAGGKSFGGRMTSQTQAIEPLPRVAALAFLGFPLHPAGAPSIRRADHLDATRVPLLFVQGTRDALADPALLQAVATRLGPRAALEWVADADHAFHVRAASGRSDAQALAAMLDAFARWAADVLAGGGERLLGRPGLE